MIKIKRVRKPTATELNRRMRRREDRIVRRGVGPLQSKVQGPKSKAERPTLNAQHPTPNEKERMVAAMMSEEAMECVVRLLRGRPLMKKHGMCGLCMLAKAVERLRPLLAEMARQWVLRQRRN